LVIPASLLVFLPIDLTVGIIIAIVLYLGCVILLIVGSPVIQVTATELIAGRARLPLEFVGAVEGYTGDDGRHQLGPGLDARAHLLIRGWVGPVARIEVTDERDPVPYWLVSTRTPDKLAAAITSARKAGAAAGSATADTV
jgi:hypothetical protein